MILCDHEIEAAIRAGDIIVDPPPADEQYSPSSLDLRLGDEFVEIVPVAELDAAEPPGVQRPLIIDTAHIELSPFLLRYSRHIQPEPDGSVVMRPGQFLLAKTLEWVKLPPQIAARVEGKSTFARLGLSVHITAPTIHATFGGKIALEIYNFGPLPLRLRPGVRICQLIFERLGSLPKRELRSLFQGQRSIRPDA